MVNMQTFFDSMQEKFHRRASGECHVCGGAGFDDGTDYTAGMTVPGNYTICDRCSGTGKENRSLEPWKDYGWSFLQIRLEEEINEFRKAKGPGTGTMGAAAAAELLDVANFACFLWLKWKGEQE
jgi:hypothetical protein